jgi:hypothetical protein
MPQTSLEASVEDGRVQAIKMRIELQHQYLYDIMKIELHIGEQVSGSKNKW